MVCKKCGHCAAKDGLCSDYNDPRNRETNIPMFPLPQRSQGAVHNNFEVTIAPSKKLTLRSLIICFILLLQFVSSVVLVGILYLRIYQLEEETKQLNAMASERMAELTDFRKQISEDINEWRNTWAMKAKLDVINTTEFVDLPNRLKMDKENDISAIHLKGVFREMSIKDKGTVGPWYIDDKSSNSKGAEDLSLDKIMSSVNVRTEGFYFVYAQIYYQSPNGSSSFSIVKSKFPGYEEGNDEVLATCSNSFSSTVGQEVSCFTATVTKLRPSERVRIVQREFGKHILLRDGQSFFGMMKLSPNSQFPLG